MVLFVYGETVWVIKYCRVRISFSRLLVATYCLLLVVKEICYDSDVCSLCSVIFFLLWEHSVVSHC
jgi:hypothetical protein